MVGSDSTSGGHSGRSDEKRQAATNSSLLRATQHKNKLLERDRDQNHRPAVIDDESDYFQTGSNWLSGKQRQALERYQQQVQEARTARSRSYKIDFAGREVSAEDAAAAVDPAHIAALIQELGGTELHQAPPATANAAMAGDQQGGAPAFRPEYLADPRREADVDKLFRGRPVSQLQRVQDASLQLLSDDGMCLSMHQPWASLLVAGIKIHEGRSWYTPYRGRLWIAAAAKVPTPQEIQELENTYRVLAGKELSFPEMYPSGCLLGRVNVLDCLPQEVYREQYPEGESDSPYVLICSDPEQLLIKLPMKGQHKIYKLDSSIHKAAKKMIMS